MFTGYAQARLPTGECFGNLGQDVSDRGYWMNPTRSTRVLSSDQEFTAAMSSS